MASRKRLFIRIYKVFRKPLYLVEAIFIYPIYFLFHFVSFKTASSIIGKSFYYLGRFHPVHKIALINISRAFPEKTPEEVERIARKSWENLGCTAGGFLAITKLNLQEMEDICPITNRQYLDEAISKSPLGVIFVTAHIGNWEMGALRLCQVARNVAVIYRHANNPLVEKLMQRRRNQYCTLVVRKGDRSGFRDVYAHLKKGGNLGILIDQKTREGVDVNFFGQTVKAVSTPAELAIKLNIPISLGYNIINEDGTFETKIEPPIFPEGKNVEEITQNIYTIYEKWIRNQPEQWFWMHNRWYLKDI